MATNTEYEETYIIPHNYTDNGKILGMIEKESLVTAAVWCVPTTYMVFKFLPLSLDYKIYVFMCVVVPPTIVALVGIGSETLVDMLKFVFRFLRRSKVYTYEK
ncbi:MAG: hypothetical protein J6Y29_00725 [Clostridiales bacterium]|nr:hypothetical protein [Clostridiales bacterium]